MSLWKKKEKKELERTKKLIKFFSFNNFFLK